VPKRATLPVLENLRWRAAKGHLELTATDLDNRLHISHMVKKPVLPLSNARTSLLAQVHDKSGSGDPSLGSDCTHP
jgi:DNA polymerase III sliding clamp (beta) subunit (PCNA family)